MVYILMESLAALFSSFPGSTSSSSGTFSIPQNMKSCNYIAPKTEAPSSTTLTQNETIYAAVGGSAALIACAGAVAFVIRKRRSTNKQTTNNGLQMGSNDYIATSP